MTEQTPRKERHGAYNAVDSVYQRLMSRVARFAGGAEVFDTSASTRVHTAAVTGDSLHHNGYFYAGENNGTYEGLSLSGSHPTGDITMEIARAKSSQRGFVIRVSKGDDHRYEMTVTSPDKGNSELLRVTTPDGVRIEEDPQVRRDFAAGVCAAFRGYVARAEIGKQERVKQERVDMFYTVRDPRFGKAQS